MVKVTLNPKRRLPHKAGGVIYRPGVAVEYDEVPDAVKIQAAAVEGLFVITESKKRGKAKDDEE